MDTGSRGRRGLELSGGGVSLGRDEAERLYKCVSLGFLEDGCSYIAVPPYHAEAG